MKVVIIGGGLQGTEAVYLAKKEYWETILIDKNHWVPAAGLCDRFIQHDVCNISDFNQLMDSFGVVDMVIPCTENKATLQRLHEWSLNSPTPLAFDVDAYKITSSKLESDGLFARLGIPAPRPWPDCGFPIVAKPDSSSGSRGVQRFNGKQDMEHFFASSQPQPGWVLQEFVQGKIYSLEIIGTPGNYRTLQVTELYMDEGYDCMRVVAPADLPERLVKDFERMTVTIAEAIGLKGIMDIEAILHNGQLKVMEIDARLPSQTPTAVYHSTGLNMLPLVAECYQSAGPAPKRFAMTQKPVDYRHIKVKDLEVTGCGEHVIAQAGPLTHKVIFFGADEAITNYNYDCKNSVEWCATLIVREKSLALIEEKCNTILNNILNSRCGGSSIE